jgi:hypothetical protein
VRVVDINQNIMPAGTLIEFSTINAGIVPFPVNPSSAEVNNVVLAVGELPLPMLVKSQPATVGCLGGESGRFIVNVTTPSGKLSTASIPIN